MRRRGELSLVWRAAVIIMVVVPWGAGCGGGGEDDAPIGDGDADADADTDADTDGDADGPCARGTYEGDYSITDAASLEGLAGYSIVAGDLVVDPFSSIQNLDGLDCLQEIRGDLEITGAAPCPPHTNCKSGSVGNLYLASVAGLRGLRSIGGNFAIFGNPSLATLDGLDDLASIGGDLTIQYAGLANVGALRGLTSLGGSLLLAGNSNLTTLAGLGGLTSIGGSLGIGGTGRDNSPPEHHR